MADEKEVEVEEEVVAEEVETEIAEAQKAGEDGQESGDAGEGDEEAKFWQDIDKEDEVEGAPADTHLRIKQKPKERDSEIEDLRRKVNELQEGRASAAPILKDLKKPNEDDFQTTEEYEAAVEKYEEDKFNRLNSRMQAEEKQRQAKEARAAAVDSHYKRASEFVAKYGIAPEKYQKADESLRKAVDAVLPDQGELVADHLISLLGDGSEKVMFRIGAKPEVLREFQALLMEDKTGLKASMFLGRQLELITNPKKRTSKAPPPGRQLKGDAAPNANAAALKKSYQEAHKKGDSQKAYNAKKQARAAGINVSAW